MMMSPSEGEAMKRLGEQEVRTLLIQHLGVGNPLLELTADAKAPLSSTLTPQFTHVNIC